MGRDPVAIVVASSRYEAEDAAELVQVQYEPLPAAVDALAAAQPGAPLVHEAWADNYMIRRKLWLAGLSAGWFPGAAAACAVLSAVTVGAVSSVKCVASRRTLG